MQRSIYYDIFVGQSSFPPLFHMSSSQSFIKTLWTVLCKVFKPLFKKSFFMLLRFSPFPRQMTLLIIFLHTAISIGCGSSYMHILRQNPICHIMLYTSIPITLHSAVHIFGCIAYIYLEEKKQMQRIYALICMHIAFYDMYILQSTNRGRMSNVFAKFSYGCSRMYAKN